MGHMTLLTDDVNQTEQYMLMKFEGRQISALLREKQNEYTQQIQNINCE